MQLKSCILSLRGLPSAGAVGLLLCGPAVSSQPFPPADGGGHVVRFDQIVFICGKQNTDSGNRRFIHSVPEAKYIPEFEPPSGDPLLPSWLVTYRIICEQGK